MKKNFFLLGLSVLCLCGFSLQAEETSTQSSTVFEFPEGLDPEAAFLARMSGLFMIEDPTSIYSFDVYSNEVEFIIDGSWETRLDSVLSISFEGSSPVISLTPPVFSQAVDLSSWVFIDNTWYFESSFAEEFTKNTVASGYMGGENSAVKHIRAGNSGIVFPDNYPFVRIGGGPVISPGIMGTFSGNGWKADALIRYDTASSRELILSGMNEVADEYIPVSDFVRGKWFLLPDERITGIFSVYAESDTGTILDAKGRRWRELNVSEFKVSGIEGIVELETETRGSIAVVYQGDYAHAFLPGESLSAYIAETHSWFAGLDQSLPESQLRIYLPNPDDSDFQNETADRYLLALDGQTALLIQEKGYFSPFGIASRYRSAGSDQEIVYKESGKKEKNISVSDIDQTWAELYRNQNASNPSEISDMRNPSVRFPLAVEFPLLYFPSTGGQKFTSDLSIRTRIYKPITSISLGSDAINGTIQVWREGIEERSFLFDSNTGILTLSAAPESGETVRITWLDTDQGTRNATFSLAGGIEWKALPTLSLTAASALRWNISQTGFTDYTDNSPGSFLVSAGIAYNGGNFKSSTAFSYEMTVADTIGFYRILGMDSRAKTFYPDESWFKSTSANIEPVLGQPFAGSGDERRLLASDRVPLTGAEDDRVPTVSESGISGTILNMSAVFMTENNWAAADILAGSTGKVEFGSAGTVALALKNSGETDNYDIYLQLGIGSSQLYEDPATLRTWNLPTPAASGNWIVRTIKLTDEDRRALASGSDMRILITPKAGLPLDPINGSAFHLLTGPIEIIEMDFTTRAIPAPDGNSTISALETQDTVSVPLAISQGAIIRRFNAEAENTVLETVFTPDADGQIITFSRMVSPVPLSLYTYISFFICPERLPDTPGSTMKMILSDPSDTSTALELSLQTSILQAGVWQKITVNLKDKTIRINDTPVFSPNAAISGYNRSLPPTKAAFIFEQWNTGVSFRVWLDEVYLEKAETLNSLRNESLVGWEKKGPVLKAGQLTILSNPSFSISALSSATDSFNAPFFTGTVRTAITLLGVEADGAVVGSGSGEYSAENIQHSVRIPMGFISAGEQFRTDFLSPAVRRDNSLDLSGIITGGFKTSVLINEQNIDRKLSLSLSPNIPSASIGQFSLFADSVFHQKGITPYADISSESWPDLWKETLSQSFSSGENDAVKRTGKLSLNTGWKSEPNPETSISPGGISLAASGESDYSSTNTTRLGSTVAFSLSAPIAVGMTLLTPSWQRSATQAGPTEKKGSFYSDTEFIGRSVQEQKWLFRIAPIADLFDSDIGKTIQDNGSYSRSFQNRYGLQWKRPSPGTVSDVFLPSSLDSSIYRTTETDAISDNIRDLWGASVKTGYTALNIAGSFGILHIFPWYEQDEFSQVYAWSSRWGNGYFTWNLDTWHSLMLFFPNNGSFVAENTFHYESPSLSGDTELFRESVRLLWKRKGKDGITANVIRKWTTLSLTTRLEDSIGFELSVKDTYRTNADYDHSITTVIGKNGEIRLSAGTGFSRSDSAIILLNLRLGLSGKLRY